MANISVLNNILRSLYYNNFNMVNNDNMVIIYDNNFNVFKVIFTSKHVTFWSQFQNIFFLHS